MGGTFRSGSNPVKLGIMQMKTFFVFLMAVAIVLPLATAYNCTRLSGEENRVCNYIEDQDWTNAEKNSVIRDMIDSGDASLDGDFESIRDKPIGTIQLNKLEEVNLGISEENQDFLIDLSSMSVFGYIVYAFLKKYYILLRFL